MASSPTPDILTDLTAPQRQAVTHIEGPMLVVAGAGSGKTRVVTRRIAYLIAQGVKPHHILAMTFTNKAANEMKQRVTALTGHTPRGIGTFHAACARFLRIDLDKLSDGRNGRFTIYDDADQLALVKECVKEKLGPDMRDDKRFQPRAILAQISRAKCDMIPPEKLTAPFGQDTLVADVYQAYENRLRRTNAVDFDDLLILTVRLLQRLPDLRHAYQQRFQYLLIDEYQDTNRTQYELMHLLAGPQRNVHVTGDPDQSIYSWRGADHRNILDFQTDFKNARVVKLEQNYRSTQTILHAANVMIRHNEHRIDKSLFTENPPGDNITLIELPDETDEAEWVASHVADLQRDGRSLADIAVFYRTNAQSRPFEEALMGQTVPYQIIGGVRFYERKEIKDILAHLKLLVNPSDAVALRRIVGCRATGVGEKTLQKLLRHSETHNRPIFECLADPNFTKSLDTKPSKKLVEFAQWCRNLAAVPLAPVDECVTRVLKHSALTDALTRKADKDPAVTDRIENLDAFLNRAASFQQDHPDADLPQFLEDVALVADIDTWDPDAQHLSLMTLHSAKGLEFPIVFIVGLEEDLLPHQNSQAPDALEEERRLFYVGVTRAQTKLHLTHAAERFLWGRSKHTIPSRFLTELPPDALDVIHAPDPFYDNDDDDDDYDDPLATRPALGYADDIDDDVNDE